MNELNQMAKEKLDCAKAFRKEKKYKDSLHLCDEIIAENQDYDYAHLLKCKNLFDLNRYEEAFDEIEQRIKTGLKPELSYHIRASWNLKLGKDADVVTDADSIIQMKAEYFLDVAYFYKSLALLNLNKKKQAMEECSQLPDDFKFGIKTPRWGFKVWTKNDLQSAINES